MNSTKILIFSSLMILLGVLYLTGILADEQIIRGGEYNIYIFLWLVIHLISVRLKVYPVLIFSGIIVILIGFIFTHYNIFTGIYGINPFGWFPPVMFLIGGSLTVWGSFRKG